MFTPKRLSLMLKRTLSTQAQKSVLLPATTSAPPPPAHAVAGAPGQRRGHTVLPVRAERERASRVGHPAAPWCVWRDSLCGCRRPAHAQVGPALAGGAGRPVDSGRAGATVTEAARMAEGAPVDVRLSVCTGVFQQRL